MAKINRTKKILLAVNILVLLGLIGSNGYLFMKNRELKRDQNLSTEEKNKRLVDEINKVYKLPDETPVVAIVTDPGEFKKQYTAFTDAQSGDYLLFFRKARLNVLYRQSEKKVVKTANVNVPITVEIVGSQTAVDAAEKKMADFGNQVTIKKTVVEGITSDFVYDVDTDQKAETDSIAKQLSYEVGTTLPSSITPGADTEILIATSGKAPSSSGPSANSTLPASNNTSNASSEQEP